MNVDQDSSVTTATGKFGPSDWDGVRKAFVTSIMVDTSLHSLAQNLDMPDWPIRGAAEVPSKYMDYDFRELCGMPGFVNRPDRVDQLIEILKGTLAFDEPFGEMVSAADSSQEKDNPILKNLAKLGIPEDYPMPLVALTAETREFCTLENLKTLREFALFAQNLAQSVIVGGDFRALLNALSHIDEQTLSLYLPYRPGAKGVHLIEGLALTVRAYPVELQAALAGEFGARLGDEDSARAASVPRDQVVETGTVLAQHTASYVEYFQADLAALQQQINEGVPLGRLAAVLNAPVVEVIVTNLLKAYLALPAPKTSFRTTTPPHEEEVSRPRGFFATVASWFKK